MLYVIVIWAVVLLIAVCLYFQIIYSKLLLMGVKHLPVFPFLGNMTQTVIKRDHMINSLEKTYSSFPDERVTGFYEFMTPVFLVRDVELLKKITVKDFEHFVDRRGFSDKFEDPLFSKSLVLLKGDEWKAMRSALSPAFTSSKIRLMVPFMVEVGDLMISNLRKKIEESGVGYIDVDTKDMSTRYANDVIATCAFGLKVDSSVKDNEFYLKCREVSNFSVFSFIKIMLIRTFPKAMKMLNVTVTKKSMSDFFTQLVLGTMKQREEQNIIRNDMIHLLMEAKKGNLSHDNKESNDIGAGFATVEESNLGKKSITHEWNDAYLVAQAFLFLLAGFETVSTAMAFMLHELALHPEIQERLYQEIKENNDNNNGKFDYNSIQRMTYLDMVVSESLRLWPPVPFMDRMCVRDYNLGKPNDKARKEVIMRKGDGIQLPFFALHRDPKYFPDPEKFDPERFNETNKHNIKPFTYLPFGAGPRNCIGSRFALCEMKVMLYQLLLNMEVTPCKKTCIPTRLAPDSLQMRMLGGHWLRIKMRTY